VTDQTSPSAFDVEIKGLVKYFAPNPVPALDHIDANIRRGLITGLVGPDGAGKTTVLRMIAGLLKPSAGELRVLALDPIRGAAGLRGRVGYMPQKFGLYEDLSVIENLTLYADLRGVTDEARTESFRTLLNFTDLARFTARSAGKLSGGMKQKLGLACVLLGEPELLLLDEPSVGVDPISRRELWKMVTTLAERGLSVVWSTSYLDEAERCGEVLLLNDGKLVYGGPSADIVERLADRARQIRGITTGRRAVLQRVLRSAEVIDGVIQGNNVRLVLREAGRLPDLAAFDAGPDAQIVPVKARLEDAFIDLLGGGPGGDSELARRMSPRSIDAHAGSSAVISAENLTRRFGSFVATDNITFNVARGEIFGLLGPNGAGKSTTFRMLCGLLKPSSGAATVMGIDLRSDASRARQRLGYMAQKFSLYGNLGVAQNLEFYSGIYGLSGQHQKSKIAEMVEVFELQPYLGSIPDGMPLGFKQRLALACALMHDPDVLFLDEPTSGVDPVSRREFWNHINGVVQKGVTVMVTTHFMDEAEYCDRIGLIYRGQMIASGSPDELKRACASPEQPDPTMEDAFITLIDRQPRKARSDAA
jgi:ABC-2 type transport system ATP-binding protein